MSAHITFVHGVGNKPPADQLLTAWKNALASAGGIATDGASGITTSMVYWADILYEDPVAMAARAAEAGLGTTASSTAETMSAPTADELQQTAASEEERLWIARLEAKLKLKAAANHEADRSGTPAEPFPEGFPSPDADAQIQRIPLPWFVKKWFLERFLRDAHHYLFNVQYSPRPGETYRVRDVIRERFVNALAGVPQVDHHIVIGHSLGSVIAYDCLKRVPGCPEVHGLITVGSPLGIDEIQDRLRPEWSRSDGFPSAKLKRENGWVNVFDPFDLVAALDPYIADDYQKSGTAKVADTVVTNNGEWSHDIEIYLRTRGLRQKLQAMTLTTSS